MWQVSFRDVKVFPFNQIVTRSHQIEPFYCCDFQTVCLIDFYHQNAPPVFRQFLQNLGYKTDKRRRAALNEVGVRDPGPPIFNFNFQTASVEIQVFMKSLYKICYINNFILLQSSSDYYVQLESTSCRVYCIVHFIIHYLGYINVCIFHQHKLNIWYFWGLFYDLLFRLRSQESKWIDYLR